MRALTQWNSISSHRGLAALTRDALLLFVVSVLVLGPGTDASAEEFREMQNGLSYKELSVGSGPAAAKGDVVVVHFTGWLDGGVQQRKELFDSRTEGHTVSYVVGTDKVMRAWSEGVVGMRVGEKRLMMVPPSLGYGKKGVQGIVPPDSPLVFEIELIELRKATPR